MEKVIKKKIVALLTTIIIIMNMFSPYTILFNNFVNAATGTIEDDALVFYNMGVTKKSNGKRILRLQIAIASEEIINGLDLRFDIDTTKLQPCNKNTGIALTTLNNLSAPVSDYYTGTVLTKSYTQDPDGTGEEKGRIRITAVDKGGFDIVGNGYQSGNMGDDDYDVPASSYPAYYPILDIYFLLVDSSLDENALPGDLFTLSSPGVSLPTGIKISYKYSDGKTDVSKDLNAINFNGFVTTTVTKKVTDITVKTNPTNTSYEHGDTIDLTGGVITVSYDDGSTEDIDMTDSGVSIKTPLDGNANVKNKTVTISYEGKTTTFDIDVTDPIQSLTVKSPMTTIEYNHGDSLDFSGLVLTATKKSGATETLTQSSEGVTTSETTADVNSSNFTQTSASGEVPVKGKQEIIFTYEGLTAKQTIIVNDTISSIEVISQPTKTIYKRREGLDLSGAKVKVTLGSGGSTEISLPDGSITVGNYSSLKTGQKQNLSVAFGNVQSTNTIDVEVYNYIISTALTAPTNVNPEYNTDLDLAGGKFTFTWEDGSKTYVDLTDPNVVIKGYNKQSLEIQTVTVEYTEKYTLSDGTEIPEVISRTFKVQVTNPVESITITAPSKTEYNHGDSLDLTGSKIEVTFANGTKTTPTMTTAMITEANGSTVNMSPAASEYTNNEISKTLKIKYEEDGVSKTIDYPITIKNNVTKIAMGTLPDKVTYNIGEKTLDRTTGDIVVTRAAGNTETVALSNSKITTTDLATLTTAAGKKTVTVTYEGKTTSFEITVVNGVTGITITAPTTTEYTHGDSLSVAGGKIEVTYADGSTATPAMTEAMITETATGSAVNMSPSVGEYVSNKVTKNLTIKYTEDGQTKTATYDITIKNPVDSIAIATTPKNSYNLKESTANAGGTLTITRKAGNTETINITDSMITGLDTATAGTGKTATVTYTEDGITKTTTYTYDVIDNITNITITAPSKIEYNHGESLDLAGGKIEVTYASGTKATPAMTTAMITESNGNTVNMSPAASDYTNYELSKTLKITYTENGVTKTASYPITIKNNVIKIAMGTLPDKVTYNIGETTLDKTKGDIIVTRAVGDSQTVALSDSKITTTELATLTTAAGKKTVTVTYEGKTTSFEITVVNGVTGITITAPTTTEYTHGDSLSVAGGKIEVTYADGSTATPAMTEAMITETATGSAVNMSPSVGEYVSNKVTKNLTIKYTEDGKTETATYNITIKNPVDSIEIATTPKNSYNLKESTANAGGTLTITRKAGNTETINITDSMITGLYTATAGTGKTATVTYTEDGITKTTTYTYDVIDNITNITITAPSKIEYNHGESLDLAGGKIEVTYASGTKATPAMTTAMITESNGSTVNMSPAASDYTNYELSKTLKITYTENGVTKTASYPIKIKNNVTKIAMGTLPDKVTYNIGEKTLDRTTGDIIVTRAVGDAQTVALSDSKITTTDLATLTTAAGKKTVTVTYEGKTTSFDITVVNGVTGITITAPTTTEYTHGDSLSVAGGKIEVTYADGSTATPAMTEAMITETATGSAVNMSPSVGEYVSNKVTKNLTIKYTEDGQTKTATYNITIKNPVDSIEIATTPKNSYNLNESTANAGGTLTITRKAGNTETINIEDSMITDLDTATAGANKTATVTYTEDGVTKTTTYKYTVIDNVTGIVITVPTDVSFNHGEELTFNGGKIEVSYAGGSKNTLSIDSTMVTETLTGSTVNMSPEASEYTDNELVKNLTIKYSENGITKTATYDITIKNNVTGIAMGTLPDKVTYNIGETTLDRTTGDIVVTRAVGAAQTVALSDSKITTTDLATLTTAAGKKTVTVTYEGKTTSFEITVVNGVTGITITAPTTTEYTHGDSLSVAGGKIEVTYADGSTATPAMTEAMITETATGSAVNMSPSVGEYISNKVTKNLTIKYTEDGKTETATYNITIKNPVDSIEIATTPKNSYNLNESTANAGGTLTITRKAGNTETINIGDSMITGLDTATAGAGKTATVTYTEDGVTKTTTYKYTVIDNVTGIVITVPTDVSFNHGEELTFNGGKIEVSYAGGSKNTLSIDSTMVTETATGSTVNMSPEASEYTNNELVKNLTIKYSENGVTKTETYNITIKNNVTKIAMGTLPDKVTYNIGEKTLDRTTGDIIVTRAAGNVETVALSNSKITTTDLATLTTDAGTKTVTVTYEEKTTSFEITVENGITSIEITKPNKTEFEHGDSLDLTGATITVKYADGTTSTPDVTSATITETATGSSVNMSPSSSEYVDNKITKNITITYTEDGQTKTLTYDITITNPVDSIEIATTPKNSYNLNESTANAGGTLTITRKAGNTETINIEDSMITGLDTKAAGANKTATVTYTENGVTKTTTYTYDVIDNVTGIVITVPTDVSFNHGEELTFNGGKIEVSYAGGSQNTLPIDSTMVTETLTGSTVNMSPEASEYTDNELVKNLTITYSENGVTKTATYDITIKNNVIKIAMGTLPNKLIYNLGDSTLDRTTGDIVVTRAVGNAETVALSNSKITTTDLATLTTDAGTKTVTVTYEGKTTSFDITVENGITSIVITKPNKTEYEHGDSLDLTGATITVTHADGTISTPDITSATITETATGSSVNMSPSSAEYTNNEVTKEIKIEYTEGNKTESVTFNITIKNPIDEISMGTTPKTNYIVGDNLDVTGGTVLVTRRNGDQIAENITPDMVSGFDSSAEVTGQVLTVTYEGKTTTYTINVTDPMKTITVNPGPTKTIYKYGEELDLTGAYIDIVKENGQTDRKPIESSMISGYNPTPAAGTLPNVQTITVTYGIDKNGNEVTDTFTVTVEDYVTEIKVNGAKTEYKWNEDLDLSTGTVEVVMASGTPTTPVDLNNPSVTVEGYNKTSISSQTLTVTYGGKTTTYTVNVKDYKTGTTIVVPTKSTYNHGDNLDLSTGKIVETWASGAPNTELPLTPEMVTEADGSPVNMSPTNYDSTNKVTKTLKITYKEGNNEITENYPITIINDVKGVAIKTTPKTDYNYNDPIDKNIGSIEVTRADGTKETIDLTDPRIDITGFDTSAPAQNIPTKIKFTENGITKETTYFINVNDNITSITLVGTPKTTYKYGESLDVSNLTLTVVRPSGTTTGVKITNNMISGYNPNKLGSQNVVITYGGKTVSYTVNVVDYLKDIELIKPNKVNYKIGEKLDLTGASITEVYASGAKKTGIPVTSSMVSKLDSSTEGTKTLTVTYTKDGDTFKKNFVVIVSDSLSGITVKKFPKDEYLYGENLELSGATIEIELDSGEKKEIPITSEMVTGYNPKPSSSNFKDGEEYTQIITISYTKDGITKTTQYPILTKDYFANIKVEGIKDQYKYGEELDISKATVSKVSASGVISDTVELTKDMISKYDSKKIGNQTLTITYEGKTAEKTVTVIDEITGISINKEPNKKEYNYGSNINLEGAKLNVHKLSGTTIIDITSSMISGYNANKAGIQTITVSYEGFTTEFTVTVKEKPVVASKPVQKPVEQPVIEQPVIEQPVQEPIEQPAEEPVQEPIQEPVQKPIKNEIVTSQEDEETDLGKVIASIFGLMALIILFILLKNRGNIEIYVVEENGDITLVGKDEISSEDDAEIDLTEYMEQYPDKVLEIVLNKRLAKKLDNKEITLKLKDNKERKEKITYNKEQFTIRLEKEEPIEIKK